MLREHLSLAYSESILNRGVQPKRNRAENCHYAARVFDDMLEEDSITTRLDVSSHPVASLASCPNCQLQSLGETPDIGALIRSMSTRNRPNDAHPDLAHWQMSRHELNV